MPFAKVDKSPVGAARTSTTEPMMRMSCYKSGGVAGKYAIAFYLNRVLIESVGWTIDTSDERHMLHVEVLEGTGEDAGYLMMAQAETKRSGYSLGISKAGANTFGMNISFSRVKHYVVADPEHAELDEVEFTYDANDHTILVQAPDWLRYNPLSLPPEPRASKKHEVSATQVNIPVEKRDKQDMDVVVRDNRPRNPILTRAERRQVASKIAKSLR
jgi:hypothetical protein